jgi:hypothetical protein
MNLDYGVIIAMIAALIFYLRLILLQRQRVKRYHGFQQQQALAQKTGGKKKKLAPQQPQPTINSQLGFKISNWYLVGFAILVIVFSAVMGGTGLFQSEIRRFWWIAFVAGIFLLNYCIR